jgi:hypothetical protein
MGSAAFVVTAGSSRLMDDDGRREGGREGGDSRGETRWVGQRGGV